MVEPLAEDPQEMETPALEKLDGTPHGRRDEIPDETLEETPDATLHVTVPK
jgi:hypothetical protein